MGFPRLNNYAIDFQNFSILKNWNSVPIKQQLLISPSSQTWQPLIHFLFLWIWLLERPHIQGIMYYLSLCDWLLSLTLMSSRFIHDIVRGTFPPFLRLDSIPVSACAAFCFSIHTSMGVWAVPASHLWWIMLLWTGECKDLFEIKILF